MIPISICVIAKNEEKHMDNFLSAIQKHFNGHPYELILVDTGSTDRTVEIAKKYIDSVYHFEWINDFSAARNYSISLASNDWILVLDCDEYVCEFDWQGLVSMIRDYPASVGEIRRYEHFGTSGTESLYTSYATRFFNRKTYHYEGLIHEQVTPLIPNLEQTFTNLPLTVQHFGYQGSETEMLQKTKRNMTLLAEMLKEDPANPYLYFQLGKEYHSINLLEDACTCFAKGLSLDINYRTEFVLQMILEYGLCLLGLGKHEKALEFRNFYNVYSQSAEFVFLMGNIYCQNGMLLQALAEFLKVTTFENSPAVGLTTYMAYYNMGYINELLGEQEAAVELYKKCGNFDPALKRLDELGIQ